MADPNGAVAAQAQAGEASGAGGLGTRRGASWCSGTARSIRGSRTGGRTTLCWWRSPGTDLEALFAETETRIVGRDWTVRWKNGFWQVPEAEARAAGVRPGSRIVVERRLSGELRFRRCNRYFAAEPLGAERPAPRAAPSAPPRPGPKPPKPGPNHPWRKQSHAEVERAIARRERRLARLAAATTIGDPGGPVSSGALR